MIGLGLGLGLTFTGAGGGGGWTPALISTLVGWWRADVGNTTTWTDQSASAANATWSSAPTSTTLGGQAAWNVSTGQHADGSINLFTAGSSRTILAVGKALDATGGALFTARKSTAYASSMLLTIGNTYGYSDGVSALDQLVTVATEVQSPFLAEFALPGTGSPTTLRLNRSNRTYGVVNNNETTETGSTGFQLLTNSAGQSWNGVIAEIVALTGSLSSGDRTNWESYVSTRYGI